MNIEKLYTEYGPMVLRRCRHLLKDEQRALDALQEVFMQVLKRQDSLRIDYPSSLLYTMATNHCLNMIRENKKFQDETEAIDPIEKIAFFDDEFERFEWRSLVEHLFKKQTLSTRTIALLHYVDGLTLEETAEVCGMSVSGIRKRLDALCKKMTSLKDFENE